MFVGLILILFEFCIKTLACLKSKNQPKVLRAVCLLSTGTSDSLKLDSSLPGLSTLFCEITSNFMAGLFSFPELVLIKSLGRQRERAEYLIANYRVGELLFYIPNTSLSGTWIMLLYPWSSENHVTCFDQ